MSTLLPPPGEIAKMPVDWVEERSGLVSLGKFMLFRNVPKDISWLQTLGSALITVFILQVTTGILLAMYYQPDPDTAWATIKYITDDATLGWLVRGMHKWGSSVMVVLLFLRNGRSTVISALAIPTSVVATFAMLKVAGLTLDTITLLALTLSVGIVIDDAIVVLENVVRFIETRGADPMTAAVEATREIGLAVLATTLSLVAVFLPVAFMDGLIGRFFRSFGLTMSFAIMVSLFVAFSLTPMLSARWLKPAKEGSVEKHVAPDGLAERVYGRVLTWALRRRWVVVIALVATVASVVPLGSAVNKNFLPQEDESRFEITLRGVPGTSLQQTTVLADRIARDVQALGGVAYTVVTAGAPAGDASGRGQHEGSVYVALRPPGERRMSQTDVMDAVRRTVVPRYPGMECFVGPIDVFGAGGVDTATVQFIVRGPNLPEVRGYADRLLAAARTVPGSTDHAMTASPALPEASLVPDREAIGARDLRVASVVDAVQALTNEPRVGTMEQDGEAIPVHLALGTPWRTDPSRVLLGTVRGATGTSVHLRDVVTVAAAEGPTTIRRMNRQRQVTVGFNVRPGVSEQAAIDRMTQLARAIRVAPGYVIEPAGNSKEMEKAGAEALLVMPPW